MIVPVCEPLLATDVPDGTLPDTTVYAIDPELADATYVRVVNVAPTSCDGNV